jgi:hypothetical protein
VVVVDAGAVESLEALLQQCVLEGEWGA